MKYRAVIFDLDGTLRDTLDDLHAMVNHTMDAFGFPRRTREEVRCFVGNGVDKLIELSVPNGLNNPLYHVAIKECRTYYAANSEGKFTKPYDGILELIEKLNESGIKVAVVSNKIHPATVKLCKKHFPTIEHAYGEREAEGIRRKPHPDMVYYAAERLGVELSECVYVGDSEVDVITSKNAGVDCISVLWGFRDRDMMKEYGATLFAENTDELFAMITSENK